MRVRGSEQEWVKLQHVRGRLKSPTPIRLFHRIELQILARPNKLHESVVRVLVLRFGCRLGPHSFHRDRF
jgi:hypothetical protein